MCGIVAAVSEVNIIPLLLEGLQRLEYRGYDSCGLAFLDTAQNALQRFRSTERVSHLKTMVSSASSTLAVVHTRWATHGVPAEVNAHPHFSPSKAEQAQIALVHNGIIENYLELKAELQQHGYVFESATDTEVVVHLVHHYYQSTACLLKAVQMSVARLKGAYALAIFSKDEPDRLIGARKGSPLVIGVAENARYLASDAMALAGHTNRILYLEEGDVVDLSVHQHKIYANAVEPVERQVQTVAVYDNSVALEPYRHYMQKEIFEQVRAIADTLDGVHHADAALFGADAAAVFARTQQVLILACGTSYYSGLTAKYWIESIAKVPVAVEVASEYRYRSSVTLPNTLVITISQSGETADTLSALRHAKSLGVTDTLTICNVATSAMVRECSMAFLTRAGVEIGVASTKAFTTQLVGLYLFTLAMAKVRNTISTQVEQQEIRALRELPSEIQKVLALEPSIIAWAELFARKENALFLGRGLHYPIALEGALKLKEISYIHAEAYPAGELKHGPLALVTASMPVVVVAPNDELLEKLQSNMQEVKARGGQLFVFADQRTKIEHEAGVFVIPLPGEYGGLSPIVHTIPLQLLAYHTACMRGTDVDKPRNLAKSVTVE